MVLSFPCLQRTKARASHRGKTRVCCLVPGWMGSARGSPQFRSSAPSSLSSPLRLCLIECVLALCPSLSLQLWLWFWCFPCLCYSLSPSRVSLFLGLCVCVSVSLSLPSCFLGSILLSVPSFSPHDSDCLCIHSLLGPLCFHLRFLPPAGLSSLGFPNCVLPH